MAGNPQSQQMLSEYFDEMWVFYWYWAIVVGILSSAHHYNKPVLSGSIPKIYGRQMKHPMRSSFES